MTDIQAQCSATTKAGDPCGSWPFCDRCGCCYVHCSHVEEERAEARRRGGLTTAQKAAEEDPVVPLGEAPRAPESMEDAAQWAAWAAHRCATGQLGNTRARSIASLLDTFRRCVERGDARAQLEETIEQLKKAADDGDSPNLQAIS